VQGAAGSVGVGAFEARKPVRTSSRGESERVAVRELVRAARARGEDLTGPEGLLKAITATVLETALESGHACRVSCAGGE
jgi:hypothetical protein